jgi:hypothetical protein
MTINLNTIFLAFALAAGVAVGAALIAFPAFRAINLPPYFIVLLALAVFDGLCFWRGGGAPGSVVSMPVRFAGFVIGAVVVAAIGYVAGIDLRMF